MFALRGDRWEELPSLNGPRAAGAATVVGDRIVVLGGQDDGRLLDTTEVFDGKKWSIGARIPTQREHLAAASDGRFAYAVGGRNLSSDKNSAALERYDPGTDSWQRLPDMPKARGGLGAAVADGNLLAVGGESATDALGDVESYDIATRKWSELPSMRTPRHGIAVAAIDRTLYALGGAPRPGHASASSTAEALELDAFSGSSQGDSPRHLAPAAIHAHRPPEHGGHGGGRDDLGRGRARERLHASRRVEGYDPVINGWKSAPDLPLRLHHEMVVTYKDEIVVIGGWSPKGSDPSGEISDRVFALRGDRWEELPSLNGPRAAGAATVVGDRIVVLGGQDDGRLLDTTEVFDGKKWSIGAKIPTQREHLAAASDGRFAYAVGGRNLSSDKNSAALERYDPGTDSWQRLPDMPKPRGGLGAAVADGNLLAVGGESATDALGDVESYNIATRKWSELPSHAHPSSRNRSGRDRSHALCAWRRAATRPCQRVVDCGGAQAHTLKRDTARVMSQENVEIVRRGYEQFAATGDFLAINTTVDFVWDMSKFRGWPEQQTYDGVEGARAFHRAWLEAWDDWELEVEAFHDAGDKVVAIVRQRGKSKTSGVPVDMAFGQVWTFRDGKSARMEMYADPVEALEAVGLSEQDAHDGS